MLGAFLDAGEVDAVEVFVAPAIEGGDHGSTPARGVGVARMADAMRLVRHEWAVLDGDLHLRGWLASRRGSA